MIYRDKRPHRGVVLLRLDDALPPKSLSYSISERHQAQLPGRYVVVTEHQVRFSEQ